MVNTIVICPDGHMIPESDCLGRTGEHNATVLRFEFFEDLNGEAVAELEKNLVAVMPEGALPFRINGDFSVPRTITLKPEVILFVEIKKGNKVLFKSIPHVFTLIDTGETEGADIIGAATETVREECRTELAESLETATGENHDGKTWEELNDTVATLSTITEEQSQALGDWDLVKFYYANLVSDYARMFRIAPKDETGADMNYRLPYIYTPKINWSSTGVISKNLLEFGVDVSSTNRIGSNTGSVFSSLPKLQRFVVTGNKNNQSLQRFMYQNTSLRYVKMETPSEEVLRLNSAYYNQAFYYCSNLATIDCELDFTGQTSLNNMFAGCAKLKDLRIKPFTLATSLDLGDCRSLKVSRDGYADIITVLNAITNDIEVARNITITFSGELVEFSTSSGSSPGHLYWGGNVWYSFDTGLYTLEKPTDYSVIGPYETPLEQAFFEKGVTIAWK